MSSPLLWLSFFEESDTTLRLYSIPFSPEREPHLLTKVVLLHLNSIAFTMQ